MYSAIRRHLTPKSLRARLTFWYLVTLGVTLTLFASVLLLLRSRSLYDTLDADLRVRASRLATELRPSLFALDIGTALEQNPQALGEPLTVRTLSGEAVYRSPAAPDLAWAGEAAAVEAARARAAGRSIVDRDGGGFRVTTLEVKRPGTDPLLLQVALPENFVTRSLDQLAGMVVVAILFVLAVAGWGSSFTVGRALAPVDSIVERVREIQAHRLGDRLDVRADSHELDRLVSTLNAMLNRIESSVSSARRFAADASHELQTPIAALRGTIDMCVRVDTSAEQWRGTAVDMLEDLDRLSVLVRDLRLIALAEAGHLLDERETVPLAELVQDCCETAAVIGDAERISVEMTATDPVTVNGSSAHLRRVVINLLQNAVRYSAPGASVRVAIAHTDDEATLTVSDSGCGIDAGDLPHIFEPFYRSDPARARDTGGSGLGLAIVEQIVRAHGGHVDVTSRPDQGSTFSVVLPVARG